MRRWFLIATIMCLAATLTACPKPKSEAVSITPETATVEIGGTLALSAHVHPPSVSQRVVWVSETPSIASVSETGVVTGESIGTTSITATCLAKPTRSASATIAVVPLVGEFEVGGGLRHAPYVVGEQRTILIEGSDGEPAELMVEIIDGLVILEGDIILATEDELDEWITAHGGMLPASVVIGDGWLRDRWADAVVPYTFAHDWDDPDTPHDDNAFVRQIILEAMGEISAVSAVRFVPRTEERDYVTFRSGNGCSSWIGRRGAEQHVDLAFGGPADVRCAQTFIVVHEILHALGFLHEHTRDDRDDFVDVQWGNIQMSMWSQYWRNPLAFDHGMYDLDSVMHYSDIAFCVRDDADACIGPTMVAHAAGATFGQRNFLSNGDIAALTQIYGRGSSVEIVAPVNGERFVRGPSSLHLSAVADAPANRATVTYEWRSDVQGDVGTGASLELPTSDLDYGTHVISVEAIDAFGYGVTDSVTIEVTKPAPEVRLQAPLEPPCVGVPITLWASVTDPYYLPYPFPSERIDWWVGDPPQQPTGNPIEVQFESEGVVPVRVRATDEVGQYAEDAIELNVQHCVIARDDTVLVGWDWGRDVTIVIDVLENDESTSGRNLVIQEVREPVWQADIEDVYLDDVGRRGLVYSGPQSNAFEYAVSDGVDSAVATVRIEPDPSPLRIEPVLEWPGPAVSCDHVPDWAWPDACCVNDRGDVALSVFRGFEHWRAHIALHDGDLIDIGTLGGDESKAFGLNDRGWVVGVSGTADGADRAFLWTPEAGMHDLGAAGGRHSIAMAVSNDGHVVGAAEIDGRSHAVLWTRGGTLVNLGALFESGDSHATGVADSVRWGPVVVGTYFPPQVGKSDTLMPLPQPTAFRWHDANGDGRPQIEEFMELGHLGSYWSMATGINAALQVVGRSATPAGEDRGFTWADGDMVALEAPGGGSTAASGINRHGYVVGSFEREDGSTAGGIWEGGRLVESDDLLPAEWTLRRLRDVNDHGILIGEAVDVERCLQPVLFGPSSRF